jgi:hypothetical protein
MTASLLRRRVMLSLRRRIRCDHNQRNRGFLVVATTRDARAHIRIATPVAIPARRSCPALRFTLRTAAPRATAGNPVPRGQS